MKISFKIAIPATAVLLCTALLLAQTPAEPQDEKAKAKAERKAKDIARAFEQNARTFTLFDRQGKTLNTVGTRAMYGNPTLSPDGKRVVYSKADLAKENQDLWVMDLATASEVQITAGKAREGTFGAVWSPDGSQVAYTGLRDGTFAVYRKAANGQGAEELLYKLPGIAAPTDWSADGRFLSLSSGDLGGSVLSALPLNASGERKPTEVFRSPKQVQAGRLSPDGRLLAYFSNESGKNEMYVRRFDPGAGPGDPVGPWQTSDQGALGGGFWRGDGKVKTICGGEAISVELGASLSAACG